MGELLSVHGLETRFRTREGIVHAVNGVSFQLERGETLGIVGESGCGKSVSVLSMLRLIPTPPGRIVGGRVMYQSKDMLKMTNEEIRRVRGSKISMVFQDPMTSLNPVIKIGQQVSEPLIVHNGLDVTVTGKVRPEYFGKVKFRVCHLPQQKITDSVFATGPD